MEFKISVTAHEDGQQMKPVFILGVDNVKRSDLNISIKKLIKKLDEVLAKAKIYGGIEIDQDGTIWGKGER